MATMTELTDMVRAQRPTLTARQIVEIVVKALGAEHLVEEVPEGWRPMSELQENHKDRVWVAMDSGKVEAISWTCRARDTQCGRLWWRPCEVPQHPSTVDCLSQVPGGEPKNQFFVIRRKPEGSDRTFLFNADVEYTYPDGKKIIYRKAAGETWPGFSVDSFFEGRVRWRRA